MTEHERKLVKEAIARTRNELGDRGAAPGAQDSWRTGPGRVGTDDANEIRDLVRGFIHGRAVRVGRGTQNRAA
jgi:hypothetical protein